MAGSMKQRPSITELDAEVRRVRSGRARKRWLRALVILLILALAAGAVISTKYFTLLRSNGSSMERTLQTGDVALCQKNVQVKRGDIVAFEREGTLLIKRVIALGGETINITDNGKVYVNGVAIEEAYLSSTSLGNSDITYPATVPSGSLFVMGDHRSTSIDSRNSSVGFVSVDELVGCVKAIIWPAHRIKVL